MSRLRPGQPLAGNLKAAEFNRHVDAAEWYHRNKALGEGGGPQGLAVSTDIIKVRNGSGSDLARGSVVGIGERLITDLDPLALWYDYSAPDSEQPWAILRRAAPAGAIEEAQLGGVCVARVDVSDIEHRYARVVSGQNVLASAGSGPVRLVQPATGTGEQELVVHLYYEPRVEIVQIDDTTKVDGWYPGKIRIYNPQTGLFSNGPDVWIIDANEPA